jgi:hypothetical protein
MRKLTLGIAALPQQAELVGTTIARAVEPALGPDGAQALARAGEEVFADVAERLPGAEVRFLLECRAHAATLQLEFDDPGFDPAAFNLARGLDLSRGIDHLPDALPGLPLLIASRSVDRFDLDIGPGAPVRIRLERDRRYPAAAMLPPAAPPPGAPVAVRRGDAAELRHLAMLLAASRPAASLPELLRHPDRLSDIVAEGQAAGLVAVAPDGRLAGGLLWQSGEAKIAELHGPFVLAASAQDAMAAALLEATLGEFARDRTTTGLFLLTGETLPEGWFESLGTLAAPDGGSPRHALFRSLEEDPGAASWSDPALDGFLEERHAELALAREIRHVGAPPEGPSVLRVAFDRAAGTATLRPVLAGADAAGNVAAHVALLAEEGIGLLTSELDLGRPLDAAFIPGLLAAGFAPRFLVPAARRGDVLVMQRMAGQPGAR